MSSERRSIRARTLGIVLAVALVLLVVLNVSQGTTGTRGLDSIVRAIGALLGLADPLEAAQQTIVELRIWRALTAVGVGAALALSGALLQGVFRNELASPSILGITAGASLGASIAIVLVAGYGPAFELIGDASFAPVWVSLFTFAGGVGSAFLVATLATTRGRVSVPTLLLIGVAVNSCAAGLIAAIQSLSLTDADVGRAVISWTFGNLDDRSPAHALTILGGVALAASVLPFVTVELDLFAGGEDDAAALGVDTQRVKLLALLAAALTAATAVAVAGAISFLGLIVPHLLRLVTGSSHRSLLPLCLLAGPVFLLGTDTLQRAILGQAALQPGVMMSLVGGPFFLVLLVRHRDRMRAW